MAADRFLDTEGLRHLWSKIKSMFVSNATFEQTTQDLESQILLPNFNEMTPIKTIEFDIASTSYYQLFSRANTGISADMHDVDDVVLFRVTCTGTNIYSQHDFLVKFRPSLTIPLRVINTNTYSATADTTGLCYVRFQYPKTLNSGYDWIFDFNAYNSRARHIKVEVFATTENISWVEGLTATTYNSTYQSDGSMTLHTRRGLILGGTTYTNASSADSATSAAYTSAYHAKYYNNVLKAGEPLSSGYFTFVHNGKAYRISNKNISIDPDYGINGIGTSYSVDNAITLAYYRTQGNFTYATDTNLTYDSLAVGDNVYLRCRLVGGKIYSDGHLTNKMSAGYTWYLLGGIYSATAVSINTQGSLFITLDENGLISHINGKPTQAALISGGFENTFCNESTSSVTANAKLESALGRSIVFNQMIPVVNWATWTEKGVTVTNNNDGSFTLSGKSTSNNYFSTHRWNNFTVVAGHWYYIAFKLQDPNPNVYWGATNINFGGGSRSTIWKATVSGLPYEAINVKKDTEITDFVIKPIVIDLTKMFGSGNEITNVKEFERLFPLGYYNYNLDGTLLGGTQTGFKSEDSSQNTLTNLSIPITTLTGKPSGSSTSEVMFPHGLLGNGDIRDEIDFDNGTAYKRVGWRAYTSGDVSSATMLTDGTYTSYVLQNAVEYTIDTVPTVEYETERGGTEKWLPVNTSTPTVAPICCISRYGQQIEVPEYTIEKLTQAETSYSASYVLKKDGTQVGATINIPKDMVVSNGEVKTVTVADEPYQGAVVGDKYIDLTIANTSQNHIYIPVKDLVDVYIAGNGIQISNNNYISVKVNQNQSNGLGVGGDGLSLGAVTPSTNGVGGLNGAMLATDKEKLDGIEIGSERVRVQGFTGQYGVFPYSLVAFAKVNGTMLLTSFTTTGGTGQKVPITSYGFPIGSNIYFYNSSEAIQQNNGSVWELYTSYRHVDARYSAITGESVSLGSSESTISYFKTTAVFLRVMIDGEYWKPFYKENDTNEIVVSIDQLSTGNFYIYLGKTVAELGDVNHRYFQLEDNNPLYYYDGTDLIDYATHISDIRSASVLPSGGTTGQVLAKASNANNDVEWVNQKGGYNFAFEIDGLDLKVTYGDSVEEPDFEIVNNNLVVTIE